MLFLIMYNFVSKQKWFKHGKCIGPDGGLCQWQVWSIHKQKEKHGAPGEKHHFVTPES